VEFAGSNWSAVKSSPPFFRVRVVTLNAVLFNKLPARPRQVASDPRCCGREKQGGLHDYFHLVETTYAHKAC